MTFRLSPDAIDLTALEDGRTLDVNESFTHLYGYSRDEALGRTTLPGGMGLWLHAADRERLVAGLRARGEVEDFETPLRRKDGSIFTALISASLVVIDGLTCNLAIIRDISARKRAEEDLRQREPDRAVAVRVEDGLTALGDPGLVRVVLENLLGNAWKYTARTPQARIAFTRDPGRGDAFQVQDNGAGFDMGYADKLFTAFQRLHSAADFEGSGIGLAIVQRIVRRHGGQVWAEGAEGAGACFHFTLPEAP
jgi:PAS domain S-box-containing protein